VDVPDLEGVFRKIDRAAEHLNALNKAAEDFFKAEFHGVYELYGETNSQRTKHLFRVKLLQPLPLLEWGLIVGDAVHCLRSALDQLAWSFSTDRGDHTAFPISITERDWVTKAPAAMWGIPKPLIAAIDESQPYHRGDAADAEPLAILRSLSNTDKHKFIPVTALVPDSAEWNITGTRGMASYEQIVLKTGRVFEDRAVIADMKFVPDDSGLEPEVEMYGHIAFRVAFGKTGVPSAIAGRPLMPAMGEIGAAVGDVLKRFDDALGGGPIKTQLIAHESANPLPGA
jgi:hypothetical protein